MKPVESRKGKSCLKEVIEGLTELTYQTYKLLISEEVSEEVMKSKEFEDLNLSSSEKKSLQDDLENMRKIPTEETITEIIDPIKAFQKYINKE